MTFRSTMTLSLTAAFLAAGFAVTANAETRHHHQARSHGMHTTSTHGHAHSTGRTTAPATGADHSADSLNAQSLSRAQGATQ